MSSIQTLYDLNANIKNLINLEWFPLNALVQRLAFQILHGNEVSTFKFVDLMNSADIGMIEG